MKARATREFWRLYDGLPGDVQRRAKATYRIWQADPSHPSLHFKRLQGHAPPVWSVRIGIGWRALAIEGDGAYVWFWIGSHAGYDKLAE